MQPLSRWCRRPPLQLVIYTLLFVALVGGVPSKTKPKPSNNGTTTLVESSSAAARVKRGYSRGHSTGVAYNRINDAGHVRLLHTGGGRGHGHGSGEGGGGHDEDEHGGGERGGGGRGGKQVSAVGEDGTHTNDFKSYGVGYEHRHGDHCEESKCGYNIRHCPHGCVFNSLLCGGGRAYDTCCC